MKKISLICAGAIVLLATSAPAQSGPGLHSHGKAVRHAKKVRVAPPPKDPYASYWNDPGRQAPPFSYSRGDVR